MEIVRKNRSNSIDMLNGPMGRKILFFALPIGLGSMIQQVFNAVDVAVVGQFCTNEALAAVGSNGSVIALILSIFIGISVGTNVVVANYIGRGADARIPAVVHTSMAVALICGFALLVAGQFIARPILELMSTPENVIDLSELYLKIYFLGMPFIMLYNFGAAVLRSIGDTKRPLISIVVAGVINAALNVFFVVCLGMSVDGVATATVISNVVSGFMVVRWLLKEEEPLTFHPKKLSIDGLELKKLIQIGVPSGLQGAVFSLSNVCIQSGINLLGSDAVAGSAVALNFEYMTYFALTGFNQAAMTFISQNYGAGKLDRCNRAFRLSMLYGILVCLILDLTFVLGRYLFVGIFTNDPVAAGYAYQRMIIVLLFQVMVCSYEITGSALRAFGYSMTPSVLTIIGTCMVRIVWVYTVYPGSGSFALLMAIYPISWIITGTLVVSAYIIIWKKIRTGRAVSRI